MGASSGFPIDLVLFGMIAAFLVLRLRSVLGRRQGFERPAAPPAEPARAPAAGPVILGQAEPVAGTAPDPASPQGQALAAMQRIDRNFTPQHFLDGAQAAFRLIVGAYAAGDRAALSGLLSEETLRAFEGAIAAREAAGETQRTEIRAIATAAIEQAALQGSAAQIGVRFVSDQVNLTLGRDGTPVAGTDAVTEITDHWTFERDLAAADPTWRLVAARSA
ncbi:MAG: Tim44 domain-containing protein [Rhodospirillales bacterium]|nr:39S ribosomal protein L45 [Rhodospirillales bacterium]MDE2200844.1 Tim44 domain-containing protein [Rhodospirillales bacterium]MDE2576946.1 Tim44 domain-containing protein [Rhodospirillales bacterium]